jgi:hypothetical protein
MLLTPAFLLLLLPLAMASRACDNPSCFVKKLFDFSYPSEDVYSISLSIKSLTKVEINPR